ncbi:MAG: hypothetical protein AB7K09_17770 [Planctomycetota bacterium]
MRGQEGIVDVLRLVRSRPFGEWNVVYYDPAKTDHQKMLDRLHANGCPRASQITVPATTEAGVTVDLLNPFAVPGDWVLVSVTLPAGAKGASVQLGDNAEGWDLPGGSWRIAGATAAGETATALVPVKVGLTVVGRKTLPLKVKVDGSTDAVAANPVVDVVTRVQ